jgi:hypothetical protein
LDRRLGGPRGGEEKNFQLLPELEPPIIRPVAQRHTIELSRLPIFCMEKPEGKRPLGKPNREWEDNIRIDLREIGWEGADRIHLAQDRNQ